MSSIAMAGLAAATNRGVRPFVTRATQASPYGGAYCSLDAAQACSKPVAHSTPFAETLRTETFRSSFHGARESSYSMTWYSRPHVLQEVHGATFGGWSQGIEARRLSSATASSKRANRPWWSAWMWSSIRIIDSLAPCLMPGLQEGDRSVAPTVA